ncbi:MAG: right-handed parallel beta-helix repeat-containing protein [Candidatus Heimdallarchaeaceae archaeon]
MSYARFHTTVPGTSDIVSSSTLRNNFNALYQGDFNALRVEAQSSPDMTVYVNPANVETFYNQVWFDSSTPLDFSGGNSPTITAPTSNPRIDLLEIDSSGTLSWVQGTEAASPTPPEVPLLTSENKIPLAYVYIPVGATMIVNYEDKDIYTAAGYIYRDVRPFVNKVKGLPNYVNCSNYDHPDDAINAIGSEKAVLFIAEECVCDTDFTVPENVTLKFTRKGKWIVNTNVTVTINGSIDAGLWQIFDGDGEITGSPKIEAVYPEWFGAKGDGVTDDTEAIQKTIDTNLVDKIFLSNLYFVSSTIKIITADISIIGASQHSSGLIGSTNMTGPILQIGEEGITPRPQNFVIEKIRIDGNSNTNTGNHGIYLFASMSSIKDCYILRCGGYGIYAYRAWTNWVSNNQIYGNGSGGVYFDVACHNFTLNSNEINWNKGYGVYVTSSMNVRIVYNGIEENDYEGIAIIGGPVATRETVVMGNYFENNGKATDHEYVIRINRSGGEVSNCVVAFNYMEGTPTTIYCVEGSGLLMLNLHATYKLGWEGARFFIFDNGNIDTISSNPSRYGSILDFSDNDGIRVKGRNIKFSIGTQEGDSSTFGTLFSVEGRHIESHFPTLYIGDIVHKWVSAVPTSGNWTRASIVYNTAPTAGGYIGWVCVRSGQAAPTWQSEISYNIGDKVVPTSDNGYYYECTAAGISGSSEPAWPTTVGNTVIDGTVTWECKGTAALFKEFGSIAP